MKIITWLLFTFICLLPAGSMAQNKVTLSGKITDQHGTPVAQAIIGKTKCERYKKRNAIIRV